jgi:hypothetical protein
LFFVGLFFAGLGFHFAEQLADCAEAFLFSGEFGAWGDGAQLGVDGDLFDDFDGFVFLVAVAGGGLGFGEIEAGDLEAVEEEAGAAGVDVVGGDALEDLADGGLDCGTVFGKREMEGGVAAAALARIGDGFSSGVVVVAELLLTEAWTGAAASVSEDVAALILFGGFLHGPSP